MTDRARRIATALTDLLGASSVLTEAHDVDGFTEDWRGRYRGAAACVVLPSSTAEVAAVVKACVAQRVPVIAQGGNTSLCGGAVPDADGEPPVIVNLQRMRAVRALDAANNSMVVEAGCVLAAVQEAAVAAGRLYPISLGAEGSCQIGGTIATNAGGTGVLRYGNTRENVLGLEVVLPDGSVWNGLGALRKNNTGFDLKQLFIGAEGTLGIVTAACLKLHPLPTAHALAWCAVRDPDAALELLALVQQAAGARLSAFEMIDALQLQLVLEQLPDRRAPLPGQHDWHVLIELADTGAADAVQGALQDALQDVLQAALERGLVTDAALAASEAQRAAFWLVRHSVSEANKKAGVGLTTDCAVPISAVPRFIAEATRAVRAFVPDMEVLVVAHLGDGNAHFIPFLRFAAWEALSDRDATASAIKRSVNDVAHALGGTFSAEHGIGRTLLAEMAAYKTAVELELMRSIKQALDPHNLFNPGRLLPARSPIAVHRPAQEAS